MKPEDIRPWDWMRMLVGEVPPGFYLELVLRTLFIFTLLVVSMRLLGRRMAGQVNRIEVIALFSLAAAIGVPLQAPDRGLLPAIMIAIVVVLIGRGVAALAFRSQNFETLAEDKFNILVRDGVVQMHKMKKTRITVERLFAQLRSANIRHLGEVKRLYFEANGSFSLVPEESPRPGLAVIPAFDRELLDEQKQAPVQVCRTCGKHQGTEDANGHCANCNDKEWLPAIY